jgi:hypothetical protein
MFKLSIRNSHGSLKYDELFRKQKNDQPEATDSL